MTPLSELYRCFQGVLPSILTTCSKAGVPNVTYLSQVYYVDPQRVALSCQFFNKTQENIAENPFAQVQVLDPVTLAAYDLDLEYERSETSGPLFDSMATRIAAIASQVGMSGVFKLRSADVYRVLDANPVTGFLLPEDGSGRPFEAPSFDRAPPSLRGELRALALVSQRLREASDLDGLFSALLHALNEGLGFEHAMVLLPDETGNRLYTVASVGYDNAGIGAEVKVGEGLIGTVAARRKTVRLAHVEAELRYGRAIRQAAHAGRSDSPAREIPLPGLPDAQSHLAIPLVAKERLLGVLAIESRQTLGFEDWHESFLDIVGHQVAGALEAAMQRADSEGAVVAKRPEQPSERPRNEAQRTRAFTFYRNDDCVFVDGEYLIRNVPGKILWKILRSFVDERRSEFNNRELRLDPSLGLPPIKDNLESRLILLRKRLEQKCPDLRLAPKARGQFRLETDCRVVLTEKDSA